MVENLFNKPLKSILKIANKFFNQKENNIFQKKNDKFNNQTILKNKILLKKMIQKIGNYSLNNLG